MTAGHWELLHAPSKQRITTLTNSPRQFQREVSPTRSPSQRLTLKAAEAVRGPFLSPFASSFSTFLRNHPHPHSTPARYTTQPNQREQQVGESLAGWGFLATALHLLCLPHPPALSLSLFRPSPQPDHRTALSQQSRLAVMPLSQVMAQC
jgi:hypothetical protein